jgi:hypothetical protein
MFQKKNQTPLQALIDDQVIALKEVGLHDEKADAILARIEKLHKMNTAERSNRVSPDTMVSVAANLVGIALIIKHEHVNVITSKALSFVPKLKS